MEIAVELASDASKFHSLCDKLMSNKGTYPLFDTRRFVGSLENAYEQVWELYKAGAPCTLDVRDFTKTQSFGK